MGFTVHGLYLILISFKVASQDLSEHQGQGGQSVTSDFFSRKVVRVQRGHETRGGVERDGEAGPRFFESQRRSVT